MKKTAIGVTVLVVALLVIGVVWSVFSRDETQAPVTGIEQRPLAPQGTSRPAPSEPGGSEITQPPDVTGTVGVPEAIPGWPPNVIKSTTLPKPSKPESPEQIAQKRAAATTFNSMIVEYSDSIRAGETTIVSNYALQRWGDENVGGVALMEFSPSLGWVVVDMGGGAPNLGWLLSLQVPYSTAQELLRSAGF